MNIKLLSIGVDVHQALVLADASVKVVDKQAAVQPVEGALDP